MKKLFKFGISAAALLTAAPGIAQNTAANDSPPTEAAAPVDPARLSTAATTVDYLFPLGTYERMMEGTMDELMTAMMGSMGDMTMGDLAGAAGIPGDDLSDEEKGETLREMALKADPNYDERMKISTKVMMDEMTDVMITMEPALREALTSIYARKYTVQQLNQMNAFFKTDTGGAFARDYMMVFVDPEMMQSMTKMIPELMQSMPDIMKKMDAATAHLPTVEMTDPSGTGYDGLSDELIAAMAAEDEFIDEIGDEPWYDNDSWAPAQRKKVDRITSRYTKASEQFDAIDQEYSEATQAAIAEARARLKPDYKPEPEAADDADDAELTAEPAE